MAFGWEAEVEHAALRDFDFLLVENLAKGYRFIDALPYVYASMAAGTTESGYKWDTINYSKPQDNPPYYRTCSYGDINVRITRRFAVLNAELSDDTQRRGSTLRKNRICGFFPKEP